MVALVTVPTLEVAERLARHLVEERLAACVNIVPGVRSIYWWQGRVEEAGELLLVLKTHPARVPVLQERLRQLHPYAVPEFLVLPVHEGYGPYLGWVAESVGVKGGGRADQE